MRRVTGEDLKLIEPFFSLAAEAADNATCHRAKCGSVIIKDGEVIGIGYNSPPINDESRRTCDKTWDYGKKPKYDLTCCIHAEWQAVIDACKKNADKIDGSTIYFMRTDSNGNFTDAGMPYCTTCSRFTMESGVSEFALWNDDGADIYELPEYDELSYSYHQ
ncbi:MAG: cytidine deaminase [Candidatus Saccharibacteria bacterium]|nr:cytidine deaminase [Candidatus Saccharibacteria bacterium]